MSGSLSKEQIDQYWKDGILFPFQAMETDEALSLVPRYVQLRNRMANWTKSMQLLKSYLVMPWVNEVVRNPRILEVVESLLGPNFFVWGASFFAKQPSSSKHVGWHQDLLYWGLEPDDGVLTAWLALTDAQAENGAMQIVPGSHRGDLRYHSEAQDDDNMLMGDQNIPLTEEERQNACIVELNPGQFSVHHSMNIHGSGPNLSDRDRIGISINYISTHVVQKKDNGVDAAMLVRGVDEYNHLIHEAPAESEFAPEGIAEYKRSIGMPSGLGTKEGVVHDIIQYDNIV